MKLFHLLFLAFVLSLTASLAAHGDEPHGKPVSVESSAPKSIDQSVGSSVSDVTETDQSPKTNASAFDILRMLHPATVHFPIALLLLAGAIELICAFRPSVELRSTVRIVLYFAVIGTVVAALFGWIHTGMWMGGEALMQRHRWVGTGLAVLAIGLSWLASRPSETQRGLLRIGLLTAAIAVALQGYWGAELSHGPNHLSAVH